MSRQGNAANASFSTASQQFGERPPSFSWASLRQEFAASPVRFQSAFRLALGCTVALCLALFFNWAPASNALIPSLLLNRPDVRYDLRQSLWAIGSVVVMGMFYYWSLNYSQSLPWFFLVLGGGVFLHASLTTLPTVGPSLSIGQVIASAVLAEYFYAPNARQDVFLPFFSSLALGFGVALAINSVVFPYSPRREWDHRFRHAWNECRQTLARWFAGEEPVGGRTARPGKLDRQLEEVLGLLHDRIKPVDAADPGPAVRQAAARRLEEIIILLQGLLRLGHGGLDAAVLKNLGADLDARFAWLGGILEGRETVPPSTDDGTTSDEPATLPQDDLRRLRAVLDDCPATFRALARLPAGESLTKRDQNLTWTPPFQWSDLRKLDARSWQQGAKVALVVLTTLVTWQWFLLPNGSSMLFLALLVMQPELGRASRQAVACALGVLLGLAFAYLATVLVLKYVETIFGYGLCIFGALGFLGYLAGASPRVAYVGFQGAISFVVVLVSSDRQSVSLESLRERFVALLFGVAIAFVVLHNVWPTRKVKNLFKLLADHLALCADAWTALSRAKPEDLPRQREEFVRSFNQGLLQTGLLLNGVELEGGEGTPRYGYAGRLLTHEVALFEQVHLFGETWEKTAIRDEAMTHRMRAVGEQLRVLAERLVHPVEGTFDNQPETPESAANQADANPPSQVLVDRVREIEGILASLDRLTALPVST